MDKYEYRLKAEQIEKLVKKKDYAAAAEIADTIDWRRVKNVNMLYVVSEIYEETERYGECMEILDMAYDRAPVGRMLLYRMTEVCTRMHNFDEAISLYREFVKAAPHDQSRFILKYQIYRERGSSLEDQIKILNEYKTHEYQEKWAYELASLYDEAGMPDECVRECDELILWFSEGEYVAKALKLKQKYEPLTEAQQEKYQYEVKDAVSSVREGGLEEPEVTEFDTGRFNTMDLQAELAGNLDELLQEDATIDLPELDVEETVEKPEKEPESEPDFREDGTIELPELGFGEDVEEEEEEEPEPDFREDGTIELPELGFTEEAEQEAEEEPEPTGTGPLSVDEILDDWEQKKAKTEALLEAGAREEQKRREKVKQETAELMKLIEGVSDVIPEDVQRILKEADEEKKTKEEKKTEEAAVTENDSLQDLDAGIEEEEELAIEIVEDSSSGTGKKKLSGDTTSLNMIQELERSLAAEVSEMAVNSGHLTQEQARLFAYFTSVKGMSQQLSVLFKGDSRDEMTNSSRGNLIVTGKQGNGKTTLAIDIVKALQKQQQIGGNKVAKISGQKLNTKDVYEVLTRLKGGALIIEGAGGLSDATMMALSLAMETDTGGLLVILEDSAEEIERLFHKNKNFASKFEHSIDIPVFTNDELVAFGTSYALEQEYSFDEFGKLALYDRIGSRQTNDHLVTVAEVKEIIDSAIEHAEKGSIRHVLNRITRRSVDEFGNRLLREADFME